MSSPDSLSIVEQWGRPGREFFEMLAKILGVTFEPSFVPVDQQNVLGRLQREILQRARESNAPRERDHTLTIIASRSIRHEAEFIANEIWRLIREAD
jgi:exodeoxyribonuclease V gamma subunit